jgi:NodT family efflux transporter outer membrane factor (OMF) lipoprotein
MRQNTNRSRGDWESGGRSCLEARERLFLELNPNPVGTGRCGDRFLSMKATVPAIALALTLLTPSCKVGPSYATPSSKVASQWQESPALTNRAYAAAEEHWWKVFGDPTLDQLVESAFRNNLSLQQAGVRVLEARAALNKSIGNLFPQQQTFSGQVGYSRLTDNFKDYLSDQLLFAASWEIDFWGKYRRGIESDRASYLASLASYDDALVTLIADVAGTYVNIRTLEERLRVARKNLELQRESMRIASVQFNAGETSERDVQQAITQLAQTEAAIPRLEETLIQDKDALAVLLGVTPNEIDRQLTGVSRIPAPPSTVAAGIPMDLLRRRPDVRAAGLNAASKSALIGVAKAEMYPSFSLSGELGISGNNVGKNTLAEMFTWESRAVKAGGGFVFPILNYGRLINQVRVQDAQFQQAILKYQNTVLTAQQEVEDGLAAFAKEQQVVTLLDRAAVAARRSTDLAIIQYKGGQTDYTTVVTAEQSQLSVEDSLASNQGNVALGLIAVYRALGGGWQLRAGQDIISDDVKAEMARRTDWGKLLEPARHLPGSTAPDGQ